MYIDMHSHILPGIDDGARDAAVSFEMMKLEKKSGIGGIVLTPHFYLHERTVARFTERRAEAYEKIRAYAGELDIKLKLGAEVLYTKSLADEDMTALCIEGTRYMLLELPYKQLTVNFINEFRSFVGGIFPDIIPILAHAERYLNFTDEESLYEIMDTDMPVQINAGSFKPFSKHSRFIYDLIGSGRAQLLGTDCHNTSSRPPDMDIARKAISRKFSARHFEKLMENAEKVFYGDML